MNDQNRTSPYNIKQKSDADEEECQLAGGLLVNAMPNSPSKNHKNWTAESKENY